MRENTAFIKPKELHLTEEQAKDAILVLQDGYKEQKLDDLLDNDDCFIPENIIVLYLYYLEKTNYQAVVQNYMFQYIDNEALVEPGVTIEERLGIADIYNYISNYDFNKMPNIFVEGLKMHSMLYSHCPYPEFGGKLRDQSVILNNVSHDVISADEARAKFQSFVTKKYVIDEDNILGYIDEVIKDTVDLIKYQPFMDGNKRTFRSLLNLMLGKIGIPPVYVDIEERGLYIDKLMAAIDNGDYVGITRFYYYKICDAIVNLDLIDRLKPSEKKGTFFVIK